MMIYLKTIKIYFIYVLLFYKVLSEDSILLIVYNFLSLLITSVFLIKLLVFMISNKHFILSYEYCIVNTYELDLEN